MTASPLDGCPLTAIELEILQGLGDGLTYGQIALQRGRSTSTVRTHLHSVYGKLGVFDRAQAVLVAQGQGWISGGDLIQESREVALLRRIDQLLARAIEAIHDRNDKDGITQRQREYLRAFDAYLRATPLVEEEVRGQMAERLEFVFQEAGFVRSQKVRHRLETDGRPLMRATRSKRQGAPQQNRQPAATRQSMAERIGAIHDVIQRLQPVRAGIVASELGLAPHTVTNTLVKMQADGMVTKVADGSGRGVKWCVLTASEEAA